MKIITNSEFQDFVNNSDEVQTPVQMRVRNLGLDYVVCITAHAEHRLIGLYRHDDEELSTMFSDETMFAAYRLDSDEQVRNFIAEFALGQV